MHLRYQFPIKTPCCFVLKLWHSQDFQKTLTIDPEIIQNHTRFLVAALMVSIWKSSLTSSSSYRIYKSFKKLDLEVDVAEIWTEIFSTYSDGINWKVRHCLVLELFINCPCCLPAQQGDNTSSAFYSWGIKMRSFGRFFSIQKQEKLWVMLDNRETKAS